MVFNSTFKNPGKWLARSGFKRKPPKPKAEKPAPRARMKTSRPKATPIRQSARDEDCTIRLFGACNGLTDTTVWAHSNRSEDGKGMGIKARDDRGAYACAVCHTIYDRQIPRPAGMTLEYVEDQFTAGMHESRDKLRAKGLIE